MAKNKDINGRFVDWWERLRDRHNGAVPPKSALDLRELKEFAPGLTILERFGPTDLRYRLTGTLFDAVMGRGVVGQNLFDLYPPKLMQAQEKILSSVSEHPCGAWVLRLYSSDGSDPPYFVETTVMPMTDENGGQRFTISYHNIHHQRLSWTDRPDGPSRVSKIVDCEFLDIGHGVPENPIERDTELHEKFLAQDSIA